MGGFGQSLGRPCTSGVALVSTGLLGSSGSSLGHLDSSGGSSGVLRLAQRVGFFIGRHVRLWGKNSKT